MSFIDLATKRRSVRRYRPDSVSRDLIDRCIEAVRISPSASNSQPWHYIVVTDEVSRREIGRATLLLPSKMNRFVASAPVIIVVVADRAKIPLAIGRSIKKLDYALIDIGISAAHFCLQAAELGAGTCMIGWFRARRIRRILNIPSSSRIALVITLGYPEDEDDPVGTDAAPPGKRRKPTERIVSFEIYRPS